MFSKRTNWQTHPNALSELLEKLRKRGERIIDLTESNPTRAGFDYLNPHLLKPLNDPENLSYEPDPKGLLTARKAVCSYYRKKGIVLDPEQIFLTASTSEAYSSLFRLLADPGDQVLVPSIGYPLFDYLAGLGDVELGRYGLTYDTAWHMDLSTVTNARSKALILVNPNNPTGNFVHKRERKTANDLCHGAPAALIADEVFFDYSYSENPDRAPSFAGNDHVLTFTLSGASKVLGLPQMKLSWIVVNGPRPLRDEACRKLEVISDSFLSVNTPAQKALPFWLEMQSEIQSEILGRVKQNREVLEGMLKGDPKVQLLHAEGGWYGVLKLNAAIPDERMALTLLEKDKVYVHPGYFFDLEEGNALVLSLLPGSTIFQEGMNRLLERLARS